MTAEALKIAEAYRDEIAALIAKGKGTWPQSDYVKDETWASWHGRHAAADEIAHKIAALTSAQDDTAGKLRYIRCQAHTTAQESNRVCDHPIYALGDTVLVWVNEADLLRFGQDLDAEHSKP
jgi:hypothetical protein